MILLGIFFLLGYRFLFVKRLEVEDRNGDGRPDHWSYWLRGEILEEVNDRNHDGKADEWTYYEEGLRSRFETDRNLDGTVDEWYYYYNDVIRKAVFDYNGPGNEADGKPDVWVTYDEKGIRKLLERDSNFDGKPDKRSIYRPGRIKPIRIETDTDFDGTYDEGKNIP